MVFSGYSGKEYGLGNTNSALRYAYGDSPLGPWRSGGVLVDSRGVVLNADGSKLITTNAGHNTHGSLQEINGQWYVFYHRPPRGFGNARQAMVAPVKITWDKKPVAKGGVVKITGYDPFAKNNEWVAAASDGNTYTGAEVTSEGFNIFGLPPYAYYSAGIACYMAGPNANEYMQDNHDVWNNSMDLAGLQNGSIIGFKYFNFEGLSQDTKGVKAFTGIGKDDTPFLKLRLTTEGGNLGAFKIHVMLDDPCAGRELAVVDLVSKEQPETKVEFHQLSNDVRDVLASLKGKHAVYLVVKGPEIKQPEQPQRGQWGRRPQQPQRPKGLFTLHGLGFDCHMFNTSNIPVVPQVTIIVDGQKLNIPEKPLMATNANGYTECNHYQLYAPLKAGSTIKAESNVPAGVKFEISPVAAGRATVKATYQGKEKIFLIN